MLIHLIEDDEERKKYFEKASIFATGSSPRSMFNALTARNQFFLNFCDDLEIDIKRKGFDSTPDIDFYDGNRS